MCLYILLCIDYTPAVIFYTFRINAFYFSCVKHPKNGPFTMRFPEFCKKKKKGKNGKNLPVHRILCVRIRGPLSPDTDQFFVIVDKGCFANEH